MLSRWVRRVAVAGLAGVCLAAMGCRSEEPSVFRLVVVDATLASSANELDAPGLCADGSAPSLSVAVQLAGAERATTPVAFAPAPAWRETVFVGNRAGFASGLRLEVRGHCPEGVLSLGTTSHVPDATSYRGEAVALPAFGSVQSVRLHWQQLALRTGGSSGGYYYDGGYYGYVGGYGGDGGYYDGGYYDDGYDDDGYDDGYGYVDDGYDDGGYGYVDDGYYGDGYDDYDDGGYDSDGGEDGYDYLTSLDSLTPGPSRASWRGERGDGPERKSRRFPSSPLGHEAGEEAGGEGVQSSLNSDRAAAKA